MKQLIGKAPHWDANRKSLYYVDMASQKEKIFRYDFKENRVYGASIADESSLAGFIIPIDGREDKLAVGLNRSVKVVKWDGKSPQAQVYCTQFELDADIKTNRVTISKADPSGRLFIGTMRTNLCTPSSNLPSGSVYRSIDGKQPQRVIGDVRVSNAMVWNPKTNKYYYTDSCRFEIKEYDWNPKTGDLCNIFKQSILQIFSYNSAIKYFFAFQPMNVLHMILRNCHQINFHTVQMVLQSTPRDSSIQAATMDRPYIKLIQSSFQLFNFFVSSLQMKTNILTNFILFSEHQKLYKKLIFLLK